MGRRQRLDVEHVDRGACDLFIPQCADQGLLSTIGPARYLIKRAVDFISASSAAPTRLRVRPLNHQMVVRMSACSKSSSLETRTAPAAWAASGSCFDPGDQIHAKSAPILALLTRSPRLERPRVFPRSSVPTVLCQPPDRSELLSATMLRALARIAPG